MTDQRKRYDGTFKARVVLESLRNEKTIAELASDYGIHPNQITQWRKQALEELPALFSSKQAKDEKAREEEKEEAQRDRDNHPEHHRRLELASIHRHLLSFEPGPQSLPIRARLDGSIISPDERIMKGR